LVGDPSAYGAGCDVQDLGGGSGAAYVVDEASKEHLDVAWWSDHARAKRKADGDTIGRG